MNDPTIPEANRRELTLRVIVVGLVLSVVMGAANVYVGLKAGMTVSASIPAAVMAMLLFRLFFRQSSILEANQVQTCASAGESLAAGIIFTMPAMLMIGHWESFDFWTVSMVALTGGLLGILFMIPMRRVFVANNDELPFPEGVACAAVLEAGEHARHDDTAAKSLIIGGVVGAVFKVAAGFLAIVQDTLQTARVMGERIYYFGGDLSPMLVAVGFIVRLNVAALIFLGGALGWLIGIPLRGGAAEFANPIDGAWEIWSSEIRYVGVGAMVVGGIGSLVAVRAGLVAAVRELAGGLRGRVRQGDSERDIPAALIVALGTLCTIMLAILNYRFTQDLGITLLSTVVMLIMGFFFTAVASYIVGLVGNSNSPVSGMTITAVLAAGGLLWLFSYSGSQGMVATLGIAAVVCCVACTSGDVCNDLKTGSLVGAAPFRQQTMQIAGVFVAAFVMSPVLTLLHNNTPGGIGGEKLSAPQASLFASLARGFSGEGELPWQLIGMGAAIGVVISIIDGILKARGSRFRAHLMPIAVGMYLPFGLAIPILAGGMIAHIYSRGVPVAQHDRVLHRGILFSSGVIAGEALTAVGLAGLAAFEITAIEHTLTPPVVTGLSLLAAAGIVGTFLVMTRPQR
jgi:putative OPT family oligopeptide transporter